MPTDVIMNHVTYSITSLLDATFATWTVDATAEEGCADTVPSRICHCLDQGPHEGLRALNMCL